MSGSGFVGGVVKCSPPALVGIQTKQKISATIRRKRGNPRSFSSNKTQYKHLDPTPIHSHRSHRELICVPVPDDRIDKINHSLAQSIANKQNKYNTMADDKTPETKEEKVDPKPVDDDKTKSDDAVAEDVKKADAAEDAADAAKKKEDSEELTKRLQKLALERQKVSRYECEYKCVEVM